MHFKRDKLGANIGVNDCVHSNADNLMNAVSQTIII